LALLLSLKRILQNAIGLLGKLSRGRSATLSRPGLRLSSHHGAPRVEGSTTNRLSDGQGV
jgi:hypothetical protein